MGAPLLALNQLEAAALITGYNKNLQARAHLKDLYVNLTGLFKRTEKEVPNAIYMKMEDQATAGANNTRITMRLPLQGLPVLGNNRLTGTEEAPTTKSATVYRNNYKKAVRVEDYGVRKLDQDAYNLYREHIDALGLWAQQYKGLDIRSSYVQTCGMTLWYGDTINQCVPFWHPHIYVQGASEGQQPAYSPSLATYTNNIVNSMIAAGGGSLNPTTSQTMDFRMMNKLLLRALEEKIWPLQIAGQDAYILAISPHQAALFSDPTWTDVNGGALWYQVNRLNQQVQNWYGILGMYKSPVGADLYIVVDHKCPTLLPGGTAEPYSLTGGYVWPGDVDLRNRANPLTRDACILWGKGGLFEWEPEPLHFVKQDDDYFRIMGHGIAGVRGFQQVHFDQANPNATSKEYYGSIMVICARAQDY